MIGAIAGDIIGADAALRSGNRPERHDVNQDSLVLESLHLIRGFKAMILDESVFQVGKMFPSRNGNAQVHV
ncbi:MAG: hypothetical protein IMZ54_04865 [Acidobacteria bacterium]|nr:hypothetical protein [Acidobacteriota bacterium]MBE3124497.1 hypothetical protein [Acidobacteriota bacterium]MBE3130037.1 hypothetical protein [Acidobacteriota bacterium]